MRNAIRNVADLVLGALIALLLSVALTLLGSALVCLGMSPESIGAVDWAAPVAGLVLGAAGAGRRAPQSPWRAGLCVGAILVTLWFVGWLYLMGRGSPRLWVHEALPAITTRHLSAWAGGLLLCALAGILGGRVSRRGAKAWLVLYAVAVLLVPAGMALQGGFGPLIPGRPAAGLSDVAVPEASRPDGTTVRVLRFDAARRPFTLGLYDADSDDASPWDDHNTTWFGQSTEFVLDKLRARSQQRRQEVLAVFNAGFFNLGIDRGRVGSHVAPVVIEGVAHYNVRRLRRGDPGWVFGVSRDPEGQRFHLDEAVPWDGMGSRYVTAIAWVRPLRVAGRSLSLRSDLGLPKLRCSRTSLGWSADSRALYVLIARDPDGETASIRQWVSGRPQTGGLDAREVQRIWEQLRVPYAVLLDGGDSTRLAYREASGRYRIVRSAYLSLTLGYWRGRPLRLFLPVLPPPQAHGGVMNHLYVMADRR